MDEVSRKNELEILKDLMKSDRSEFLYIKGRRRVGKSWLLDTFSQKHSKQVFYFTGSKDSKPTETLNSFAKEWTIYFGDDRLRRIHPDYLSWNSIFESLTSFYQEKRKNGPYALIFDEIQWIAKEGVGFCGTLKKMWVKWEKLSLIKIIVCGSSAKFFDETVGGEEKLLRGLQTRAPLQIEPFSFKTVREKILPNWSVQEAAMAFLCAGGIPYYLARIPGEEPFVQAMNEAFFTRSSIFLSEADEILDLEFNAGGIRTVRKILSAVGQDGSTAVNILKKTKIAKSTLSETLKKLLSYQLVVEKENGTRFTKSNKVTIANSRLYMTDFFLNFYFSILQNHNTQIASNHDALYFSNHILAKNGFYIEGFSGKAFELLVRFVLKTRGHDGAMKESIFKKLKLCDVDYDVGDFQDKTSQIDLIVEHKTDRVCRVIECKIGPAQGDWLQKLCDKRYPLMSMQATRLNVIALFQPPKKEFLELAEKNKVVVLTLLDLL